MKLYKAYALITFLIFRTLNQVQGNYNKQILIKEGKSEQGTLAVENHNFADSFIESVIKNESRIWTLSKRTLDTRLPSPIVLESLEQKNYKENILLSSDICKSCNIFARAKESKKIYTTETRLKTAMSPDAEVFQKTKISYPEIKPSQQIRRPFHMQKIFCRQITKTEVNRQGDTVESVQHICEPKPIHQRKVPNTFESLKPSVPSMPPLFSGRHFGNLITSTSKGINCRRVMNSELNELGEIVDSVTEVCDPPPTTTTTTRKPPTTPRVTTTTRKQLIKVCRPVMNSYLNEKGEIIDSVSIVCKMEQVN